MFSIIQDYKIRTSSKLTSRKTIILPIFLIMEKMVRTRDNLIT